MPNDQQPRALYFLHIPKTAGTAVIDVLDRQFAAEAILPAQLIPALDETTSEVRTRARLVRGHLGARLSEHLEQRVTTFTVLRDPVERTLSHFAHIQREPGHYLHRRVASARYSITDFLADPDCRSLIGDHQARHLVRSAGDPPVAVHPFEQHPLARQIAFELAPLPPVAELRTMALAALNRMDAVGVAEDVDQSLDRLARRLGWGTVARASRRREGSNRLVASELPAAVREEIVAITTVDAELVAAARESMLLPICEPSMWWWDPTRRSKGTRGWGPVQYHDVHGWHRWSTAGTDAIVQLDGPRVPVQGPSDIEIEVVAAGDASILSGLRADINGFPIGLRQTPTLNGGCRLQGVLRAMPSPPLEIRISTPARDRAWGQSGTETSLGVAVGSAWIRPERKAATGAHAPSSRA
jgi:hypothetical protein